MVVFDMLRSRFLAIESREQASRIIRRASTYFILASLVLLALQGFSIHDEWLASRTDGTSTTSAEAIAAFIGYLLGHLLYEDWVYVLVLVNAFVLRRYNSRVAAVLFIVFGLYGAGLALFVLFAIGPDALLVSGFLTAFFASCAWVAGRALVAAIKLRGGFRDDDAPAASAITGGPP